MNLAQSLEPYRHSTVFTQSPLAAEDSKYRNDTFSNLLHRETVVTAFQYPFALNLNDCKAASDEWTRCLLKGISELNGVSGNHARSYYEMAPASILVRLTNSLVADYKTYGFKARKHGEADQYDFPEVIEGIMHDPPDYPGQEFYIGGQIVKDMNSETSEALTARGVTLDRSSQRLLETVANKALES